VKRSVDSGRSGLAMVFLSLCFVSGIFIGRAAALNAFAAGGAALSEYLDRFIAYRTDGYSDFALALTYARYPVAAYLFGFSPAGAILIPLMLLLAALSMSFTVNVFTLSMSDYGLLLSLFTVGFRYIFVLPCLFFISAFSIRRSLDGAGAPRRRKAGWTRTAAPAACVCLLFAGAAAEHLALPRLLVRLSSYFT
jgi:hypothetical protein